jgi:hypothetical protein
MALYIRLYHCGTCASCYRSLAKNLHAVRVAKLDSLRLVREITPEQMQRRCLLRGTSAEFVDGRQCAAVLQREAVTVMPSCSDGGNVVVA